MQKNVQEKNQEKKLTKNSRKKFKKKCQEKKCMKKCGLPCKPNKKCHKVIIAPFSILRLSSTQLSREKKMLDKVMPCDV